MDKGDFLSLGRSSPESSGSGSPIKAIRVSRDQMKESGELLADSVGWPSTWNENEFDKARNACQRRKVGVLLTENRQLSKDRKAAVRSLQITEEKLTSKTAEALRLREVNALVLERLRQSGGSRQAELRIQENKLRVEFDEAMQRVRGDLERKYQQERQAAVKQERCEVEQRFTAKIRAAEGSVQDREKELDEVRKELDKTRKALAEVKGSLEEQICKQRGEVQRLEEEKSKMRKDLEKMKREMENDSSVANVHVMMLMLKPEEQAVQSVKPEGDYAHEFVCQSPFEDVENSWPEEVDVIEEREVLVVDEQRGSGNCTNVCQLETPEIEEKKEEEKEAHVIEQVEAPEFTRPIPSGIMWADLLDTDDARWYAESTVDGDEAEEDFGDLECEEFIEDDDVRSERRFDHEEEDEKREVMEKDEENRERGSGGSVDGYEEPSWWCKNEPGTFRAFSHFRDITYDGGSRNSSRSIRSARRSYDSPSQSPRFINSKASTPTTDSSREWTPKSHDNGSDQQNPWPEWSNKGGSREFGNIQKVSPGVLVVERRPSFGNTGLMPPRRSQSDVPQCRRWLAGYCRFQERCWFRHE